MQADKVVKRMLTIEGISSIQASRRMNRSDGYLSRTISGGLTPGAGKLAEIGDALGYDLLLRKRDDGTEIIIDPPKRK